jgi:hypothetical protein
MEKKERSSQNMMVMIWKQDRLLNT